MWSNPAGRAIEGWDSGRRERQKRQRNERRDGAAWGLLLMPVGTCTW